MHGCASQVHGCASQVHGCASQVHGCASQVHAMVHVLGVGFFCNGFCYAYRSCFWFPRQPKAQPRVGKRYELFVLRVMDPTCSFGGFRENV